MIFKYSRFFLFLFFPYNLHVVVDGRFSSCIIDAWYSKHWNAKRSFLWHHHFGTLLKRYPRFIIMLLQGWATDDYLLSWKLIYVVFGCALPSTNASRRDASYPVSPTNWHYQRESNVSCYTYPGIQSIHCFLIIMFILFSLQIMTDDDVCHPRTTLSAYYSK